MENYSNDRQKFDEQRRKKAENFHLSISNDAFGQESENAQPEEINSYSGQDVKEQIARESQKSLKKRKREQKRELKKRNKHNRRIFRVMWLVSIILIGTMAATYIVTGMNDLLAINRTDDSVVSVTIPANPTLDSVTEILVKNGIINESSYFKMFANMTKSSNEFAQGTYELRKNMDYQAILTNLAGKSSRTDTVEVTIIEGMSVIEIADKLVEEGALSDKQQFLDMCASDKFDNDFDFIKAISNPGDRYYKLEGYLYPDKYEFYHNDDPVSIIYKFLNNYESKLYEKQAFDGYEKLYSVHKMIEKTGTSYNLDQVLTIASIIQAEAANKEDMYIISSILHNRLSADADMGVSNLSLDSTKYYPYRTEKDLPATAGKNYKSKYDTYSLRGLPPGPICNPGNEAIKAALLPSDTSYYYFCHDKDGQAYYASTIYEHEANLDLIK